MAAWLATQGHVVNRKRVRRLMRLMGLVAIYQRPNTSKPAAAHKIYPYLLGGIMIERVNQVWCSDVTYIPMAKGFLYLVVVMDWASRAVLGWRLSNTLGAEFCVEALEEALAHYGRPEIFNTDQGSQFTSDDFTGTLKRHEITISMDGKGRCMDNIFVERLWRSLKYEEVVCCGSLTSAWGPTKLYRRWRKVLRNRPAGAGSKPPQAARVKSPGGERCGKGGRNSARCGSRRRTRVNR
jgi:putative transposase